MGSSFTSTFGVTAATLTSFFFGSFFLSSFGGSALASAGAGGSAGFGSSFFGPSGVTAGGGGLSLAAMPDRSTATAWPTWCANAWTTCGW